MSKIIPEMIQINDNRGECLFHVRVYSDFTIGIIPWGSTQEMKVPYEEYKDMCEFIKSKTVNR